MIEDVPTSYIKHVLVNYGITVSINLNGHSGDVALLHGLHSCTIIFSLLFFQIAKSTVHTKTVTLQ